jgi:hypothetical protein
MASTRVVVAAVIAVVAAVAAVGCSVPPTGPSLSNVSVSNLQLKPTIEGRTDLCCCRVVGEVGNQNQVPVHVTLKFSAFRTGGSDPLSAIIYFVPDLAPGSTRPIDAAGFVYSCSNIDELRTEVDLRGITSPPT